MHKCSFQNIFVILSHCAFFLLSANSQFGLLLSFNAKEFVTFSCSFAFQNTNSDVGVWRGVGNSEYNW